MLLDTFYASAHLGYAALGLAVLWLLGDGAFRLLRLTGRFDAADAADAVGLRLLLGLAAVPGWCIGFDLAGIAVTRVSLVGAALGSVFVTWGVERARTSRGSAPRGETSRQETSHQETKSGGRAQPNAAEAASPSWRDHARRAGPLAYLFGLGVAGHLVLSASQVFIYPPRVYDALVGWDLVGKVLALEGAYRSSVFTHLVFNAQTVYAPFCASNQGYWYLFYPTAPQAWVAVLGLGFALIFWSRLARWTMSPTAASLGCFFVFTPPEVSFHMGVGQTDLPSMVFTAAMFFATVDLVRGRAGVLPVVVWSVAASATRSEALLFALACSAIAMFWGRFRPWAALPAIASAVVFAFWNLFYVRTLIGYDPGQYFLTTLEWDGARALTVVRNAVRIVGESGELAWLIPAIPALWLAGMFWPRAWPRGGPADLPAHKPAGTPRRQAATPGDSWAIQTERTGMLLAALLALSFLFYLPFFYQWNPDLNPLWTMAHTFKRGYFRFIPGLVAVTLMTRPLASLLLHSEVPVRRLFRR